MLQSRFTRRVRQRLWHHLKMARWLVVPAIVVAGLVEYNAREARIESDYASLSSKLEQSRAAQDLVMGCFEQGQWPALPKYIAERVFGNCRSLEFADLRYTDLSSTDLSGADLSYANLNGSNLKYANLHNADLYGTDLSSADLTGTGLSSTDFRNANLRFADLYDADLPSANLRFANLSFTNFSFADLRSTDLGFANLTNANLLGADLSFATLSFANLHSATLTAVIFLSTDLSSTKHLILPRQAADLGPFICNSLLPDGIEIEGGMDRDCDIVAEALLENYSTVETVGEAKEIIAEERRRKWE